MKTRRTIGFLLALIFTFTISAGAHSGRTDARGGHHDYKNISGLGSYHYHCGGYSAHLHINEICPYKMFFKEGLTFHPERIIKFSTYMTDAK